MTGKRKRSQNFTYEEKDKLIKILALYKDTILNKKTDAPTNEAKASAWTSVTARFNSSATINRSKDSLFRVWEKLKTEAKLYNSAMRDNKTGGGPKYSKIDPVLEQVCSMMGRGCAGISNVRNSDADDPLEINNLTKQRPTTVNSDILSVTIDDDIDDRKNIAPPSPTNTPPIWWRPVISQINEDVPNSLYSNDGDHNLKRLSTELKHQILTEEIEFKRELYQLQIESAKKELEIKTELLKHIKDGKCVLQVIQQPPI